MRHQILFGADNINWLFETALKAYAQTVARPLLYSLDGNEDAPERVELFNVNHWEARPYAVFVQCSDGALRETSDAVLYGMARAYFADSWARIQEEKETDSALYPGAEIMDVMPDEMDSGAMRTAENLRDWITACNGVATLAELYAHAETITPGKYADRKLTPELFGHYCAMSAMGHGVGLDSFGIVENHTTAPIVRFGETPASMPRSPFAITVPYLSDCELDKDY